MVSQAVSSSSSSATGASPNHQESSHQHQQQENQQQASSSNHTTQQNTNDATQTQYVPSTSVSSTNTPAASSSTHENSNAPVATTNQSHLPIDKTIKNLITSNLIPKLVAQMKSEDENIQFGAVHKFRTLLSQDCLRVEDVEEQGAIQLFIQFLQKFEKPKLQSEAAWCCSAIAGGSSQDTKAVVDAGIIPLLSQLLHQSKDENVLQNTLDAISNIACDCVTYRDMCLNQNILHQVINIIEGNPDTLILRSAASAISSLCGGNHQPLQVSQAALPVISKLLTHSDDDAVESACWAASYLSQGDNSRIQAILDHNMVEQLVSLLQHPKSRIQSPALKTVGNIVTGDDKQTQAVVDAGALPILRTLLKHKQFRQEAAWTISNITAGNAVQVKAVIDSDIIPPLIHILRSNCEWDVKKEAGWAIANATEHASDEHIRYLVKMKCVKPLCELISCMDEQLIAAVLGGLKNILVSGHKLRSHGEKLVYARQIYEAGGVDAILALKKKTRKKDIRRTIESIEMFYDIEDSEEDEEESSFEGGKSTDEENAQQHDAQSQFDAAMSQHQSHLQNSQMDPHSGAQYSDDESTTSSSIEMLDDYELPFIPKHKFVIRQNRPGKKYHESEAEKRFRRAKMRREQLNRQVNGKKSGGSGGKGKKKKKGKGGNALADKIAKQLKARKKDPLKVPPVVEGGKPVKTNGSDSQKQKAKRDSDSKKSSQQKSEEKNNQFTTSQSQEPRRKKRNGANSRQPSHHDKRSKKRGHTKPTEDTITVADSTTTTTVPPTSREGRVVRFPPSASEATRKSPPSRNNIIGSGFSPKPPRKVKPIDLPTMHPAKSLSKSTRSKPEKAAKKAAKSNVSAQPKVLAPGTSSAPATEGTAVVGQQNNAWKTPFVEVIKKDDTTTDTKDKGKEKHLQLGSTPWNGTGASKPAVDSNVSAESFSQVKKSPPPASQGAAEWSQPPSRPVEFPKDQATSLSSSTPSTTTPSGQITSNSTSPLLNLNHNLRNLNSSTNNTSGAYSTSQPQSSQQQPLSTSGISGNTPNKTPPSMQQQNTALQSQQWNPVYQVFGTHLLSPNLSTQLPHAGYQGAPTMHHLQQSATGGSMMHHGMAAPQIHSSGMPLNGTGSTGNTPPSSNAANSNSAAATSTTPPSLADVPLSQHSFSSSGSASNSSGGNTSKISSNDSSQPTNTYNLFSGSGTAGHHGGMISGSGDGRQEWNAAPMMQWQTFQPQFAFGGAQQQQSGQFFNHGGFHHTGAPFQHPHLGNSQQHHSQPLSQQTTQQFSSPHLSSRSVPQSNNGSSEASQNGGH